MYLSTIYYDDNGAPSLRLLENLVYGSQATSTLMCHKSVLHS